jgi:hypothetical protein
MFALQPAVYDGFSEQPSAKAFDARNAALFGVFVDRTGL